MDIATFERSPTGHLVRVGQGDAAYAAFIPNPLPPSLTYDGEIVRVLSEADFALGRLAGLGQMLPDSRVLKLLSRPFARREAVLSSRIEGTETGIIGLYAYEADPTPTPGVLSQWQLADAHEVHNYVRALDYGIERMETLPVSLRFICELHEILMDGVRGGHARPGEFRTVQNYIGAPGSALRNARYVPPPPDELRACLDALERYLHTEDTHPALVRLAFVHYQFEAVHPFVDGNGRIGRLLISLLLYHWNMLNFPLFYPSAYLERHRREYYDLLLAVSERGVWAEWVTFFLRGVAEQAQDACTRALRLADLHRQWHARALQGRQSAVLSRLIDTLFEYPVITIPLAQTTLDVTYRSAQLNINKLVSAGVLRPLGEAGYGKMFMADEILRIVGGDIPAPARPRFIL